MMLDTVQLVPYQSEWIEAFEQEKNLILNSLDSNILDIQHIGSTSIPGMEAKPIIDILLGLNQSALSPHHITTIEKLDYLYEGQVLSISEHHFFRKGMPRTHHLHVAKFGSAFWQRHILFRDFLRSHPVEAEQYAQLKRDMSNRFRFERKKYAVSKTSFIESILDKARVWKEEINDSPT